KVASYAGEQRIVTIEASPIQGNRGIHLGYLPDPQVLLGSVALLPAKRARLAWPQRRPVLLQPALFPGRLRCVSGVRGDVRLRRQFRLGRDVLLSLHRFLDRKSVV